MSEETKSKKVLLATSNENALREWLLGLEKYGLHLDPATTDELMARAGTELVVLPFKDHQFHFTSSFAAANQADREQPYEAVFIGGYLDGSGTDPIIDHVLKIPKTTPIYLLSDATTVFVNVSRMGFDCNTLMKEKRLIGSYDHFDLNEKYLASIFGFEIIKAERQFLPPRAVTKRRAPA